MKRILFACLLSSMVGAVVAVLLVDRSREPSLPVAAQETGGPRWTPADVSELSSDFEPEERVNIAVYEKANRSVVNIQTLRVVDTGFFMMSGVPAEGAGSGIVLDKEGHILTNFHVIDDVRQVQVTLFDQESYGAEFVGADPQTDMAVLKIDAPPQSLHPVHFGTSSNLRVGQRVFAIGNPFGLDRTMTTGIISNVNRTIPSRERERTIKQVIQIDAAINPGNSGGPLLDTHARLIGMNTAIASRKGENAGVGFAIPVDTILRVVPQLVQEGAVRRPYIGLEVHPVGSGLMVTAVEEGGPADRAGLQGPRVIQRRERRGGFTWTRVEIDRSAADIILAVDGKPVASQDAFFSAIESREPGQTVRLTVQRQRQKAEIDVVLGAEG